MPRHGWVPSRVILVPTGPFAVPWCCGPGPPRPGTGDCAWLAECWAPGWFLNSLSTRRGSCCELQCPARPRKSCSPETSISGPSLSRAINCQQKAVSSTWAKAPTTHPPPAPAGVPKCRPQASVASPPPPVPSPSSGHHGCCFAADSRHQPIRNGAARMVPPSPAPRPHHVPPGPAWGMGTLSRQWDAGMPARLQPGWVPGRRDGQERARWLLRSCCHGLPSSFTSPSPSSHAHQH